MERFHESDTGGFILVSREARKPDQRSKPGESGGPSNGSPIRKRFLGSEDRKSCPRMRSPCESRTLIILVPDRVVQDMYLRYGVIYAREWESSVSAPFAFILLVDTRDA